MAYGFNTFASQEAGFPKLAFKALEIVPVPIEFWFHHENDEGPSELHRAAFAIYFERNWIHPLAGEPWKTRFPDDVREWLRRNIPCFSIEEDHILVTNMDDATLIMMKYAGSANPSS